MKTRLFDKVEEPNNPGYFRCLKGFDVISAHISDHHPVVHDGILFWNIMMQGKKRNGGRGTSYNNGFGIVENEERYQNRLKKVAEVIAETLYHYPAIDVISLCEGPIESLHINTLLHTLKQYPWMKKFFAKYFFHKPNTEGSPHWGLLMLADKKYQVSTIECDAINRFDKLANRFQIWQLTNEQGNSKYLALGHFPFGGDERVTEKQALSVHGENYCDLIRNTLDHYSDEQFILCADFNLNPYLISEWKERAMDSITHNNSILLTTAEKPSESIVDSVTVDGILLSNLEKQKYAYSKFSVGLFARLKNEDDLFQSNMEKYRMLKM